MLQFGFGLRLNCDLGLEPGCCCFGFDCNMIFLKFGWGMVATRFGFDVWYIGLFVAWLFDLGLTHVFSAIWQ